MNLIGKKIRHKTLGVGTVVTHEGDIFAIEFPTKISKFQYNEATFQKFLVAEEAAIHAEIMKEFEEQRKAVEQKRLEEELIKKTAEEARLAAEAAKSSEHIPLNAKKTLVKSERIPGKRMTFYVFQGSTFDKECRGGYIWAPISNKSGNKIHHWERLLDIHPGDIILHGYNAHVQAVSVARDYCYECNQPEELRTENQWDLLGRRVDCEYIVFKTPIKTALFTDDILRLCNVKYAPFDKDGNGNMGYLYEINRELARIFLRAAATYHVELGKVDYISELLAEGDAK